MTASLEALESRRSALLRQIRQLGAFRPGSISATTGRCGNPRCRCRRPDHPGHGPNLRLTFRRRGKTVTLSLPNEAARRKAQREIDEFRRWQQLSREYVEVNAQLCQARPVEDELSAQEKKRPKRSSRKSPEK
jgi:hypothetical protein